jgi:hypothetical protein
MRLNRHAEKALVALDRRIPGGSAKIIARLRAEEPASSKAIEVCRLQWTFGCAESGGTNGNSLVVIARDGVIVTAMLRRSWNQPFTPEAMRVDAVERWTA